MKLAFHKGKKRTVLTFFSDYLNGAPLSNIIILSLVSVFYYSLVMRGKAGRLHTRTLAVRRFRTGFEKWPEKRNGLCLNSMSDYFLPR